MRIGEDARRSVLFFGVPAPKGIEYGGTGFLIRITEDGLTYRYVVTNRHVAVALAKWSDTGFLIRVNLKSGGSDILTVEQAQWAFPDDPAVDLAVASFGFEPGNVDHVHLPLLDLLIDHESAPDNVMCGDAINIVGLFRLHSGNERNIPFVHNGHIAVLPDPKELVPIADRGTGELIQSEVYLVEAQTLDGLSGSPVFAHGTLDVIVDGKETGAKMFGPIRLLGVFQGSWDGEPGKILAKDRDLRGNVRVPVGMGAVVPAVKLRDLVMKHPLLKSQRAAMAKEHLSKLAASSDSAIPSPPASDANPTHQEDFNSLVNAAARKRERED